MRIPIESYAGIRNEQGFLVLPKEFECRDGKFKQLKRTGDLAIYQRDSHFEVIKIISQMPFEITKGVLTEQKENFPSSTTWGVSGWTLMTLDAAEKKFNELLNPEIKSAPKVVGEQVNPIVKRKRGRPHKNIP